jgi:hypothetical protein
VPHTCFKCGIGLLLAKVRLVRRRGAMGGVIRNTPREPRKASTSERSRFPEPVIAERIITGATGAAKRSSSTPVNWAKNSA